MSSVIKDAAKTHWVYKMPQSWQPFLQLSRLDRPIGYWLLALPGWIGLAFASLSIGFASTDIKWAVLILIGAIAMRGAGCTYNDIVDQDLDKQVERTALRPLPAGTISNKQAWAWLAAQCAVGLIILLCLPRLAQVISLLSIPLVAAYPFMKRITWWPQLWLGLTFNWAVLVAYAAKTGEVSTPLFILYAGLIFWTVGYDTIYACQDIEDDAMIGVKSTARRFGSRVKLGVGVCYALCAVLIALAIILTGHYAEYSCGSFKVLNHFNQITTLANLMNLVFVVLLLLVTFLIPFILHLAVWQIIRFDAQNGAKALKIFKSNGIAALLLIFGIFALAAPNGKTESHDGPCNEITLSGSLSSIYVPICNNGKANRFCENNNE